MHVCSGFVESPNLMHQNRHRKSDDGDDYDDDDDNTSNKGVIDHRRYLIADKQLF